MLQASLEDTEGLLGPYPWSPQGQLQRRHLEEEDCSAGRSWDPSGFIEQPMHGTHFAFDCVVPSCTFLIVLEGAQLVS